MSTEYRIVTNGKVFRIQRRGTTGWLWWKKPAWIWQGIEDSILEAFVFFEFDTLEAAKAYIAKRSDGSLNEWNPVQGE